MRSLYSCFIIKYRYVDIVRSFGNIRNIGINISMLKKGR